MALRESCPTWLACAKPLCASLLFLDMGSSHQHHIFGIGIGTTAYEMWLHRNFGIRRLGSPGGHHGVGFGL
jgi:hypothetical protein